MSSHDETGYGGFGLGAPGLGSRVAIDETPSNPLSSAGAAGGLTLDEAENIAARRLQELAIRLDSGDAEQANEEPGLAAFDADRHLRARLARRIVSLGGEDESSDDSSAVDKPQSSAQRGLCLRYAVSEALPLSAFGEGLAALSHVRAELPEPARILPEIEDLDTENPEEPAPERASAIEPETEGEEKLFQASEAMPDSAMRLVDLIRQQRLLLDRLGRLKEFAAVDAADVTPAAEEVPGEATSNIRSDAEELFEAGTYASEAAVDDDPGPVTISAEQLIAALRAPKPAEEEEAAPVTILKPKPEIDPVADNRFHDLVHRDSDSEPRPHFTLHQPGALPSFGTDLGALDRARKLPMAPELASDAGPERPPIIIERARAELTALANGTGAPQAAQPSAAIGFFAGLSLSLVCGMALYFML